MDISRAQIQVKNSLRMLQDMRKEVAGHGVCCARFGALHLIESWRELVVDGRRLGLS